MALPRARMLAEIAGIADGRDITRGVIDGSMTLEPQDAVLLAEGQSDYEIYEDLKRDDAVWAAMQQRRAATVARPLEVVPGGDDKRDRAAADFLREAIENAGMATAAATGFETAAGFDSVQSQMLWSVLYGFSVAEVIWARDGRFVVPREFRVRNRRRFRFDSQFRLRLITPENGEPGEEMPARKFWIARHGADNSDEPYGLGLGHVLYWLVLFKRHDMSHWLTSHDRFGTPALVMYHPEDLTTKTEQDMDKAVASWSSGGGLRLPDSVRAEILAAANRAGGDFEAFCGYLDKAIVTTVLSETMTTEDGSSRSQAEVHMEVRKEVTQADNRQLSESFAPVSAWLTEWNFPGARPPTVRRVLDDPPTPAERLAVDTGLAQLGFRVSREHVERHYDVELTDEEAPPAPAPELAAEGLDLAAALGAPAARGAIEALDRVAADVARTPDAMLDPVLELARRDPGALMRGLQETYDQMDASEIERTLGRLCVLAEVTGDEP